MKRLAVFLVVLAAACAPGAGHGKKAPVRAPRGLAANPSAVIATEIAFARAARSEGQWTAFRDYAAPDAVMFVPQAVAATDWLKGRPDPAQAVEWQPHEVWMSCDGTLAVTTGAWQRQDGSHGYFTTAWARQEDGEYRWTMDQGDVLDGAMPAPDMISGHVASCDPLPPAAPSTDAAGGVWTSGKSRDGTLGWSVRVDRSCGRIVTVSMYQGMTREEDQPGTMRGTAQVLRREVRPPQSPTGAPDSACAP